MNKDEIIKSIVQEFRNLDEHVLVEIYEDSVTIVAEAETVERWASRLTTLGTPTGRMTTSTPNLRDDHWLLKSYQEDIVRKFAQVGKTEGMLRRLDTDFSNIERRAAAAEQERVLAAFKTPGEPVTFVVSPRDDSVATLLRSVRTVEPPDAPVKNKPHGPTKVGRGGKLKKW